MNLDRKSRRSSILKPSKDEDSPATTTIKKRRVSFAEKKHIKEFCHSVEQGTVWDNTYEESDSSHIRTSQSSQTDDNSPDKQLLNDPLPAVPKLLVDKNNDFGFELQEETIIKNVSKDFVEQVEYCSNSKIPIRVESQLVDLGSRSEGTMVYQNQSMDLTEAIERISVLPRIGNDNIECANLQSERTTVFHDDSMDFTQVIGGSSEIREICHDEYERRELNMNRPEKITVFHDASMELTEAIERISAVQGNAGYDSKVADIQPERTTIFDNATMEFTNVVQKPLDTEKISYDSKVADIQPERTTIFDNATMEFTNVVQKPLDTEKISYDSKVADIQPERTTIFDNATMEFTNVVQKPLDIQKITESINRIPTIQGNAGYDSTVVDIQPERTTIFDNATMDFTQVVRGRSDIREMHRVEFQQKELDMDGPEKTTIFHDVPMELTEAIERISALPKNYSEKAKASDIQSERTTFFANETMEFTNVVSKPSDAKKNHNAESDSKNLHCIDSDNRTIMFRNEPMDFTETLQRIPVSSANSEENVECNTAQKELRSGFDATASISLIPRPKQNQRLPFQDRFDSNDKSNNQKSEDGTTVVNVDMEMITIVQNVLRTKELEHNIEEDLKTKSFYGESLELTDGNKPKDRGIGFSDSAKDISGIVQFPLESSERFNSDSIETLRDIEPDYRLREQNERTRHFQDIEISKKIEIAKSIPVSFETNRDHGESLKLTNESKPKESLESSERYNASNISIETTSNNEPDYRLREQNGRSTHFQHTETSKKIEFSELISLEANEANKENIENAFMNSIKASIDLEAVEAPSFLFADSISIKTSENIESNSLSTVESNVVENYEETRKNAENRKVASVSKIDITARKNLQLSDIASDELVNLIMDIDATIKRLNKSSIKHSRSCHVPSETDVVTQSVESEDISVPKSSFCTLKETIEALESKRNDNILWSIDQLDEKLLKFHLFSKSIRLAIHLNEKEKDGTDDIKKLEISSELDQVDSKDRYRRLIHRLIMEKLDSEKLSNSYRNYEDIPKLLEHLSDEVKLGVDFMKELKYLDDRNIMEIQEDSIFIRVRTRNIDDGIIINITIKMKPFEEIKSHDVTVGYLLGARKVRESDIKQIIMNVKRDHRFLRTYVNDIKDYLDLMALTFKGLSK